MPSLIIDGREVPFTPGQTILQAAAGAGITIPSLCALEGIEPPVSCFVCIVRIEGRAGMVPSCATPAESGMVLYSNAPDVRGYRKKALELLLSEHAGDCEAPCARICPAALDIPAMSRYAACGDTVNAARTIWERIPLPGVLGHVCTAPCEKGCRRKPVDGAVSIRKIHTQVAAAVHEPDITVHPSPIIASGKRVAIIGAGPAGLTSAFFLSRLGHACTIYDDREEPGGMLRYGIDRTVLPLRVLEKEIGIILKTGVAMMLKHRIGLQFSLDELITTADAVIIATGAQNQDDTAFAGVKNPEKRITVEAGDWQTTRAGVFACGGVLAPGRMAVRAVGQGRLTAESVHRFLMNDGTIMPRSREFDSHLGRLNAGEIGAFVATDLSTVPELSGNTVSGSNMPPRTGTHNDDYNEAFITSAARCLQCDCGKKNRCDLRRLAGEYGIQQNAYRSGARKGVMRTRYGCGLMHEPGKCIDCGRCIGITESDKTRPGLTFSGRGFDVAVSTPFGAGMDKAMGASLDRCTSACPTGALWNWNKQDGLS